MVWINRPEKTGHDSEIHCLHYLNQIMQTDREDYCSNNIRTEDYSVLKLVL